MQNSILAEIFIRFVKLFRTSEKLLVIVFLLLSVIPSAYSQPHWVNMTGIPLAARYDDIYFINTSTGYAVSGAGLMYKTTDGAITWTNNYSYTAYFRSIGFFDANNGVMGTLTEATPFFRTTNGGANWSQVTDFQGTGPVPKGICGINIVNENLAYAVGRYESPPSLLKSSNKGANWTSIPIDTSLARGLVDAYFWSADSGIVVGNYSPTDTLNNASSAVLLTTNGGTSFTRVFLSSRTNEWCWKISFPSKNIGYISVQSDARAVILKTTNHGLNWTDFVFTNFINIQGIGFVNDNTGWAGKSSGAPYKTTDGGATWAADPWGLNVNRFRILNDSMGFAAGRSVYKYSIVHVGIQSISSEVPDKFSLRQNYPNPFNPSTIINYQLIINSNVTLKIYDNLGDEVETLVNEKQNAGSYSVDFNASLLPSGIYFYKLVTENFSETKKMILLK